MKSNSKLTKLDIKAKEHVQLGFGVQNRPYFENCGPKWSKRGSVADKHNMLHVID